jgi:hypothetical protein
MQQLKVFAIFTFVMVFTGTLKGYIDGWIQVEKMDDIYLPEGLDVRV